MEVRHSSVIQFAFIDVSNVNSSLQHTRSLYLPLWLWISSTSRFWIDLMVVVFECVSCVTCKNRKFSLSLFLICVDYLRLSNNFINNSRKKERMMKWPMWWAERFLFLFNFLLTTILLMSYQYVRVRSIIGESEREKGVKSCSQTTKSQVTTRGWLNDWFYFSKKIDFLKLIKCF